MPILGSESNAAAECVAGPFGQVLDRAGEQRREQGLLPQDEGGLLQIPRGGGRGRRAIV